MKPAPILLNPLLLAKNFLLLNDFQSETRLHEICTASHFFGYNHSFNHCIRYQVGPGSALGEFLSPQHGFWQNAEPIDKDFGQDLQLPGLKTLQKSIWTIVWYPIFLPEMKTMLIIYRDILHAKFRLWQMEFQTYAAAGRISELIGPELLNYDREKRRLGMGYAAEKAVAEMEKDPVSKAEADSYTAGVNAYITNLKESELPIEYKLLGYKPEFWTNLKTALFLKFMSLDLAGFETDFEYTNLRSRLGYSTFNKMFPITQDSLDPIVPVDTFSRIPGITLKTPPGYDSVLSAKHGYLSVSIQPNRIRIMAVITGLSVE